MWSDEFDGEKLDDARWTCRYPGPRKGGVTDPTCSRLDGKGNLVLDVRKEGEKVHAGMVDTSKSRKFKFGHFECRMTLPKEPGFWTAFWLTGSRVSSPEDGTAVFDDTRSNGAEIDVFEYFTALGDQSLSALNWNGYGDLRKNRSERTFIPNFQAQPWHVVGVEWRPDGYTFFVDGRQTWTTTEAPSHAEQEIILSTEVGPWAGDITKAKLPQQVLFDYVRVWQRTRDTSAP